MMSGMPMGYWLARGMCSVFVRSLFGLTVRGIENVPLTGGCLLASNHVSFLDPPVLGSAISNRLVHFMARRTLFQAPIIGRAMPRLQLIPVDRDGGDAAPLKTALRLLRKGDAVAMFPEGTRSPDGKPLPPRGGIGFLIAKAGVPVVPVCLEGTFQAWPRHRRFPRFHRVQATFGPPILPDEIATYGSGREAFEPIAHLIMDRIAALATPSAAASPDPAS